MNWKLNKAAWIKVGKGAALGAAGFLIAYLGDHLGELDLGPLTGLVGMILAVLLNYVRKAAGGDDQPGPPPPDAEPPSPVPPPGVLPSPWAKLPPGAGGQWPLAVALALAFWCATPAHADVRISGQGSVPANRMARLEVIGDTKAAAVSWDVSDELRLDTERCGNRLLLTGPAGQYLVKVSVFRVVDGAPVIETARFTLTLEGPPGPGPGPGPTPPAPGPITPLARDLLSAYLAESDPGKAAQLADLAQLYAQAPAQDEGVRTYKALSDEMRAAAVRLGLTGKLPGVQKACAGELQRAFPADLAQPIDRALAGSTLARVASALREVQNVR